MGYFANGTEGERYMQEFCFKCVNWRDNGSGSEGCPIIDLHMMWNYDAVGKNADTVKAQTLSHFIPREMVKWPDGIEHEDNAQCVMFQLPPRPTQRELELAGQQRLGRI